MAVATIEPSVAVRTIAIIVAASTGPRPGTASAERRSRADDCSANAHSLGAEQNRASQSMRDPRKERGELRSNRDKRLETGAGTSSNPRRFFNWFQPLVSGGSNEE